MTLNEAIKHAEEVAIEQDKLCKRYDDASGYSRSHNEAIRTTDAKRCEECAEEHRQLAAWLKELKQLKERTIWIPVSEKMPGHYEVVLACCNDDFVTLASFSYKEDRWECLTNMSSDTYFPENEEIIAWMPLPEPYEEVQE